MSLGRLLLRYLVSFVAIVLVLLAVNWIIGEVERYQQASLALESLRQQESRLVEYGQREVEALGKRVASIPASGENALRERVEKLDEELRKPHAEISPADILAGRALDKAQADVMRKLLLKERRYFQVLLDHYAVARDAMAAEAELERRRQLHAEEHSALIAKEAERDQVSLSSPILSRIPGTEASRNWKRLQAEYTVLRESNDRAHESYISQREALDRIPRRLAVAPFEFAEGEIRDLTSSFAQKRASLETQLHANWANKLREPIANVVPTALLILLGVILIPLATKFLLYFVIAPIASGRPPVILLPDVGGDIGLHANGEGSSGARSSVSKEVRLGAQEEMLVHPEYLQSTSDAGTKSTKWLLDWSIPIASMASGMLTLTRIRAASEQPFVVSSTRDPLSELGLVVLPQASAVVLQPRNLVGIVQPVESPVRITQHWRLFSVNAWLTLQLRYLVFHGPGTLIVRGCRGMRVEKADGGKSVNQAATIGFSANLAYSARRYETFLPYLMGKQGLFNDNFSGGPGYCIYEEMPRFGKRSGITGRGIEGLVDGFLKIFGI